jgi:hypothetical protein
VARRGPISGEAFFYRGPGRGAGAIDRARLRLAYLLPALFTLPLPNPSAAPRFMRLMSRQRRGQARYNCASAYCVRCAGARCVDPAACGPIYNARLREPGAFSSRCTHRSTWARYRGGIGEARGIGARPHGICELY